MFRFATFAAVQIALLSVGHEPTRAAGKVPNARCCGALGSRVKPRHVPRSSGDFSAAMTYLAMSALGQGLTSSLSLRMSALGQQWTLGCA